MAGMEADPIRWLLEAKNPSARYYALTDILDKPQTDPDVAAAKQDMMRSGPVPEILSKQRDPAYEEGMRRFYHTKYWGLVWQLIVLAELGAQPDEQIVAQCEYLLRNAQTADGGFAMQTAVTTGGGRAGEVIPCLCGNAVWSLIRLGYLNDPRLQKGIGWLTGNIQLHDGEDKCPVDPRFNKEACWGKHTCFMGVIKPLKALAAIPEDLRTGDVRTAISSIAEYFLIHHIYKRSRDLRKVSKPGWLKFGFPLMYQTDVLEILDILTSLGIHDARMGEAIEIVRSKRGGDGRWEAENTANNGKLLVPFSKDDQDKWVTLRAMRVLRRWDEREQNGRLCAMKKPRAYTMTFASVYPLYIEKVEKKGRTKAELDEVIFWLTGYDQESLQKQITGGADMETFYAQAPRMNPNASLIKGVICGYRVEEIEDEVMRKLRWLDKLVDELAKGKSLEQICRK